MEKPENYYHEKRSLFSGKDVGKQLEILDEWQENCNDFERLAILKYRYDISFQTGNLGEAAVLAAQQKYLASHLLDGDLEPLEKLSVLVLAGRVRSAVEDIMALDASGVGNIEKNILQMFLEQIDSIPFLNRLIHAPVISRTIESGDVETLHFFASRAFELKDFALATELYTKLIMLVGPDKSAFWRLCDIAEQRRAWTDLANHAAAWLEFESESQLALKYALQAYSADQRTLTDDQAESVIGSVENQKTLDPWLSVSISKSLVKLGWIDLSYEVMLHATKSAPENLAVQQELSLIEQQLGRSVSADNDAAYISLISQIDRAHLTNDAYRNYAKSNAQAITDIECRTLLRNVFAPVNAELINRFYKDPLTSVLSRKFGSGREAGELKQYGAADWKGLKPLATRLARNIDGFAGLTLQNNQLSAIALDAIMRNHLWIYEPSEDAVPVVDYVLRNWSRIKLSAERKTVFHQLALSLDEDALDHKRLPHVSDGFEVRRFNNTIGKKNDRFEKVASRVIYLETTYKGPIRVKTNETSIRLENGGRVVDGYAFQQESGELYPILGTAQHAPLTASFRNIGSQAAIIGRSLKTAESLETAMFVPSLPVHYRNFFHFMGQLLPRLAEIWGLHSNDADVLVLPAGIPSFVLDMLDMLGIPQDRIRYVTEGEVLNIQLAYVSNPTTHNWQNSVSALDRVRADLRVENAPAPHRRLFLTRPPTATNAGRGRAFLDEADYVEAAQKRGFEAVDPSVFSLREQRDLFSSAQIVVGATGAALSNILFMQPSTHVAVITPRETCRTYYPGMCLGDGPAFHWIAGTFETKSSELSPRFPHLPFTVSVEQLHECLDWIDDDASS